MSAYKREQQLKIESAVSRLVQHLLQIEAPNTATTSGSGGGSDENYDLAYQFCLHHLNDRNHQFMATGRQQIRRSIRDTIERLTLRNETQNAKSLEALFARFERSLKATTEAANATATAADAAAATAAADRDPDSPYQIIALLTLLASTRALMGDTVLVAGSPLPVRTLSHTAGVPSPPVVDLKSPVKPSRKSNAADGDAIDDEWANEFRYSLDADSDADEGADADADGTAIDPGAITSGRDTRSQKVSGEYDGVNPGGDEEAKSPSPVTVPAAGPPVSGLMRDLNNPKSSVFVPPPSLISTAATNNSESNSLAAVSASTLTFTKSWNLLSAQVMQHRNEREHAQRTAATASASKSDLTPIVYTPPPVVTEQFLVSHLVYLLFGLTGEVFALNESEQRYEFRAVCTVTHLSPLALRLVVRDFVNCANQKLFIADFIARHSATPAPAVATTKSTVDASGPAPTQAPSTSASGQCWQAFACSLRIALTEFDREIMEYERIMADVNHSMPVTFLSLSDHIRTAACVIDFIANLLARASQLDRSDSGSLLSLLHDTFQQQTMLGSPSLPSPAAAATSDTFSAAISARRRAVSTRLFADTLRPYVALLDGWCTGGVLNDPANEFMILARQPTALAAAPVSGSQHQQQLSSDFWSAAYAVRTVPIASANAYASAILSDAKGASGVDPKPSTAAAGNLAIPNFLAALSDEILLTGKAHILLHALRNTATVTRTATAVAAAASTAVATTAGVTAPVAADLKAGSSDAPPQKRNKPKGTILSLVAEFDTVLQSAIPSVRDPIATAGSRASDAKAASTAVAVPTAASPSQICAALQDMIRVRYRRASKRLLAALLEASDDLSASPAPRVDMIGYLGALRSVLLLENSDVTNHFTHHFFHALDDSDVLEPMRVTQFLSDALKQNEPVNARLMGRISVTGAPLQPPDPLASHTIASARLTVSCIDQFTFSVRVAWPLNLVCTPDSIARYNQIFRFLLQIRRAAYALRAVTTVSVRNKRQLSPVLHQYLLAVREIRHFVSNIEQYVMMRCVHSYWPLLVRQLETSTTADIDVLRSYHIEYLNRMQRELLLYPNASAARTNIISILNACLELRVLFQLHINPYLQSLRNTTTGIGGSVASPSAATAATTTGADSVAPTAKSCIDRINELRSSFRSRVRFLVVICSQLVEHGLHPELSSLLNGLNFNSFYTNETNSK